MQELFLCSGSPCSTQYNVRGLENYVENVSLSSFYDKLPHRRNTANVFFSKLASCTILQIKMNVGVWALTFEQKKRHVCSLFHDVCTFIFEKKDVFGTLSCFKSEQNSIRIPLFSFFFFFSLFCMTSSMSIALDNQLRQKEKKTCRGPYNSVVSPQSIYMVGCFIWVIRYVNLLHIIWYD